MRDSVPLRSAAPAVPADANRPSRGFFGPNVREFPDVTTWPSCLSRNRTIYMIIVLFRQEANAGKKEGGQFRHFEARAAAIALGASRPSPRTARNSSAFRLPVAGHERHRASASAAAGSLFPQFGNIAALRNVKSWAGRRHLIASSAGARGRAIMQAIKRTP